MCRGRSWRSIGRGGNSCCRWATWRCGRFAAADSGARGYGWRRSPARVGRWGGLGRFRMG